MLKISVNYSDEDGSDFDDFDFDEDDDEGFDFINFSIFIIFT